MSSVHTSSAPIWHRLAVWAQSCRCLQYSQYNIHGLQHLYTANCYITVRVDNFVQNLLKLFTSKIGGRGAYQASMTC